MEANTCGPESDPVSMSALAYDPKTDAFYAGGRCYLGRHDNHTMVVGRWDESSWATIGQIGREDAPHDFISTMAVGPDGFPISEIHLYPNPSQGISTLSVEIEVGSNVTAAVYNVLVQKGRSVLEGVTDPGERRTVEVNFRGLSSGVYFLLVRTHRL